MIRLIRPSLAALSIFVLLTTAAPWVRGDEVVFKNGDRLTGTVQSYDGSKLTVETQVAGKVTVDLKAVKSFTAKGPLDIMLSNGATVRGTIAKAPDGQILVMPEGAPPRVVPFADLSKFNPPVKWTGSLTVGGLIARGNTNTETLNIAAHAERRSLSDRIILDSGYIYARQHNPGSKGMQVIANNVFASGEYDYFFTRKFYGYGSVLAAHDTIAGIDLRLAPGVGVGYQWIDTPALNINTEAGAGWLYRKYANDGEQSSANARAAYHIKVKFNERVTGFHDFEYLPGLDRIDNYFFNTDAGIRSSITDHMFTEFKTYYQYDSKPAPGKGPSDLRFILGVGWNF